METGRRKSRNKRYRFPATRFIYGTANAKRYLRSSSIHLSVDKLQFSPFRSCDGVKGGTGQRQCMRSALPAADWRRRQLRCKCGLFLSNLLFGTSEQQPYNLVMPINIGNIHRYNGSRGTEKQYGPSCVSLASPSAGRLGNIIREPWCACWRVCVRANGAEVQS